jgi:hypothetical protein
MHSDIDFSDSLSPNSQHHNIVQSQNKNSIVFPHSETILPSQYNSAEAPPSESKFVDTTTKNKYFSKRTFLTC